MLPRVDRAVRLLERGERCTRVRATDEPEVAVDLVRPRQLADERRVVPTLRRRPHALRDLAADAAEVGDDAGGRGPREAVVVADQRGRSPAELLVDDLPEAGVPLRAVAVVAEQVPRCDLHRRVLRPGGADDHGLRRILLRPVRDGDRLVTRERADHHVCALLVHQPTRLLQRKRGSLVAAADADEVQPLASSCPAGHSRRRLLLVLRLGARVLGERRDGPCGVHLVPEREGALAVGHDRDAHLAALRRCCESPGCCDRAADCQNRQGKQELPPSYLHVASSRACAVNLPGNPAEEPTATRLSISTLLPSHSPRPRAAHPRCLEADVCGRQGSRADPRDPSGRRARRSRSRGR